MSRSTVFILAGGNDRGTHDYAKRLEAEIAKHVTSPKMLSCFFSHPEKEWDYWYDNWQKWFSEKFKTSFTYDYAKKETFLNQVDTADVIYLHGGDTHLLLESLPDTKILIEHFKDKVVVGSSAGANALSKKYWSSSKAEPGQGLGIVNTNVMVHYGVPDRDGRRRTMDDWKKEEADFQAYVGSGKITRLSEGQFIVKVLDI